MGFMIPDKAYYENEFEKEVYMTVCILRKNPKVLIKEIEKISSKNQLA